MTPTTWHALCAVGAALVTILLCGVGAALAMALAPFAVSLWHAAVLFWSFRPARRVGWCCTISGSRGRLVVAWMTV